MERKVENRSLVLLSKYVIAGQSASKTTTSHMRKTLCHTFKIPAMTHRNPEDRDFSIRWAQRILENKSKFVILDTETTGLKRNDVVIEIAVIDLDGNELFSSLIRPTKRKSIPRDASAIHGIKISDLAECPTFTEVVQHIQSIIANKTVLIYNAEFDEKLIDQTCEQDDCDYLRMRTDCAMIPYSQFIGKWSEYHYDYTYQKLPSGDHTAIGDCRATLKIIEKMANSPFTGQHANVNNTEVNKKENNVTPAYKITTNLNSRWWEFWK